MSSDQIITIIVFVAGQLVQFVYVYNRMSVQIKELQVRVHKLEGGERTTFSMMKEALQEIKEMRIELARIK